MSTFITCSTQGITYTSFVATYSGPSIKKKLNVTKISANYLIIICDQSYEPKLNMDLIFHSGCLFFFLFAM